MAKSPYQLLRIARMVFLVLAYLNGVSIAIFAGLVPLITGGAAVPLIEGGPDVPVRVLGVLNILLTAPLTFLALYTVSGILHLLLGLRDRQAGS